MTLLRRLAIAAAAVMAVVAASGILIVRTVRASQIAQLDRQLTVFARAGRGFGPAPPPARPEPRPSLSRLSSLYIAVISDGHRQTFASSSSSSTHIPAFPSTTSTRKHLVLITVGSVSGPGSWRAVLVRGPGTDKVLLAVSLDEVDRITGTLWVATGTAEALTLLVLLVAWWWVYRLGVRPIAEVTDVADAIAAGDRSRRVRLPPSTSEAGHLARTFNLMLDERDATEQRLRQFLADASHELRTPVTVVSGLSDMWRDKGMSVDSLEDAMRRIGRETSRMRALVEHLLLLARLDEGSQIISERLEFSSIVADALQNVAEIYPSRQVLSDLETAEVRGDETQLRQVVTNLVRNAMVHTPPLATTTVELRKLGGTVVLTVSDDGPGLSPEETARAFDRFWRADAARSRSGSGLGLPIVKAIVEAHGGHVYMRSRDPVGTVVVVELRTAQPTDAVRPELGTKTRSTPLARFTGSLEERARDSQDRFC